MPKKYPTLTEMGISNPEEIERYSLQSNKDFDILRIIYKRKKGSLLPTSKNFRFGRSPKMVVTDGGTQQREIVNEISPFLTKATNELHQVVKNQHSKKEKIEIIMDEIRRLEEETNTRITYLKSLVKELD